MCVCVGVRACARVCVCHVDRLQTRTSVMMGPNYKESASLAI